MKEKKKADKRKRMSKISIKNMNLYYGDFHALKDVNLEIEANKITACLLYTSRCV